jgi:hypothetical protein
VEQNSAANSAHAFEDVMSTVYEAKFMLPWSFSEGAAAEKYMAQLQHNMWVTNARTAALSIITGGGKWVEISVAADPLYQHLLLTAEKKFWRCVQSGDTPRLFGVEPPRPRIEAVRSAPEPVTTPSSVAAIHWMTGCFTRLWTFVIAWPVLRSYQVRLSSSVARPSWTMRLPERSSGPTSPRFSCHRRIKAFSS